MELSSSSAGASYYQLPIPDKSAVHFTSDFFRIHADGVGDDAPALQQAINQVQETRRAGVILIPPGHYRLGSTVYLWRGVRLIGYGGTRPTFVLGENTPGFQQGTENYLFHFCNLRPYAGMPLQDANNCTFFSGISNCNIEIAAGNPAATAVRFFVAQHSSLEHIDFHIGAARAAVEKTGNEIEDCRFFGGDYAIITQRTSACWQSLLLDCEFTGQRVAAISSEFAGLTVVRGDFRDTPCAIEVMPDRPEQLFLKDSVFTNISRAVIEIDGVEDPEIMINVRNVGCTSTPVFVIFRGKEPITTDTESYHVHELCYGLQITGAGKEFTTFLSINPLEEPPQLPARDYPALPPMDTWVNVRDFGAGGNGVADDTEAFRKALATGRAVYIPLGFYRITETLELPAGAVLIGLHPIMTQIMLSDYTPGFADADNPVPMVRTAKGESCHITGISLNPGVNLGAISLSWRANEASCLDDVYFSNSRQQPELRSKLNNISLHVCDGGGGTLKNIWSANMGALVGVVIEDTETPGRIYLMSVEHHRDNEVIMSNVANWEVVALQTEENKGSEEALALELTNCLDVSFANFFAYRVMSLKQNYPQAVAALGCCDVVFYGFHAFSWGKYPFDNAILMISSGSLIPELNSAYISLQEDCIS